MMRMNRLTLAVLMALPVPALADGVTGLGTALLTDATPRAEFSTMEAAREGTGVTLILPDPSVPGDVRILHATLGATLPDAEAESGGLVAFALPVVPGASGVGFALIDPSPEIAVTGGALRVDVTGDGVAETLTVCLTTEGVHLSAVDDKGAEVWQGYQPLGYDVEPTCP